MGRDSKIEWTDHTFNLWWGCVEQGPECDHCYARELAKRFGFDVWGKDAPRRYFGEKHLQQLFQWNRAAEAAGERKRVFVQSMGDICEIGRDEFNLARVRFFEAVEQCQALDFLLLTKLPQNFERVLPTSWKENPRSNVVGMVTCGHPSSVWRIQQLLATPFWRRGVSMEPLLARCAPTDLFLLDWVIVGGESGHAARPMHAQWAREVRDRCSAAGVPFFFKQWGEWLGEMQDGALADEVENKEQVINASDSPIRVGKARAGNRLDGRVYQEFYRPVGVGR